MKKTREQCNHQTVQNIKKDGKNILTNIDECFII